MVNLSSGYINMLNKKSFCDIFPSSVKRIKSVRYFIQLVMSPNNVMI